MKNIFQAIVAKTNIKPEIAKVLVTPDKMVATNSYVLIEVKRDVFKDEDYVTSEILRKRFPEKDILVKASELDHEPELMEVLPVQEDGFTYPDYKQIIPKDDKLETEYYSISLNPHYLADIAKAISNTYDEKMKTYQRIEVFIPKEGHNRPLFIRRDDKMACGLIMPVLR